MEIKAPWVFNTLIANVGCSDKNGLKSYSHALQFNPGLQHTFNSGNLDLNLVHLLAEMSEKSAGLYALQYNDVLLKLICMRLRNLQ